MTATTADVPVVEDRPDRLSLAAAKLRSRRRLPVDKWFQLGGAVLMGLGLLAILGGWYGVSHTARAWRQTPYIMSGGLLGLGLVFAGGFAYFAFWLTRLVEQGNRQLEVLERIDRSLREQAEAAAPRTRKRAG